MATPTQDRRPRPSIAETKPFWDAAARGQLADHGLHRLRQGALVSARHLPVLLQRQDRMARGSGQGHDLHLQRHARAPEPYAIAYVTLAEGPTMMTNIVDCDLDTLQIGQPVTVVFRTTEGGPPVPMFTPV